MSKGRKPPEAPQIPQMPAPPEILDFIDEISGTQAITVIGPNGKKQRKLQRLPLTPEEQAIVGQAENLIRTSMTNIERLYKLDPATVVDYQPFIQTFSDLNDERMRDLAQIGNFQDIAQKVEQFRQINKSIATRAFDRQGRMNEEVFAAKGIQNSTAAAEQRAAFAAERGLLEQQADVSASDYGENLIAKQLAREGQVYDINEKGRQSRLQQAELGYSLEKQKQAEIEQARQAAIGESQAMMSLGQGFKQIESDKANNAMQGNASALSLYNTQASDQVSRYNANVQRIMGQYKMDLENHKSRPATFGQKLTDMGFQAAGSWLSAPGGGFDQGISGAKEGYDGMKKSYQASKTAKVYKQRGDAMSQLQQLGR